MPSQTYTAKGAKFQRDNGASYDSICKIKAITLSGMTREIIADGAYFACDGEADDSWINKLPGLKDAGEITIEVDFDPDTDTADNTYHHDLLAGDFNSDDEVNYRIEFPDTDSTQFNCAGYVSAFNPFSGSDPSGKLAASFTITLSGEATIDKP